MHTSRYHIYREREGAALIIFGEYALDVGGTFVVELVAVDFYTIATDIIPAQAFAQGEQTATLQEEMK